MTMQPPNRRHLRRHLAAVLLLGTLIGGASAGEDAATAAPVPSAEDLKNPEWIQAGKTRFVQVCAYCHGTEGEAGKTRSFKTREAWDPQVIHDTIAEGRVNGPNVMPSWKGSISDDVIWKIVAYIKSLSADYRADAR
jgi:mono/diheme cytochrome c family protein